MVLGLGYATLIPDNGVTALRTADVDEMARLAGFLIDAGPVNSSTLLEVGPRGLQQAHSANPTTVQDVFIRIGGAGAGKATTSMVINSRHTIIDHTWVWRAGPRRRHQLGDQRPTTASASTATTSWPPVCSSSAQQVRRPVVRPARAHHLLPGRRRRTTRRTRQPSRTETSRGTRPTRSPTTVTTHEGWGLGSYCYYNVDPTIVQHNGFAAPNTPGVKFHDLLVVSLGGQGQYKHVVNETGAPTSGTSTVLPTVASYP